MAKSPVEPNPVESAVTVWKIAPGKNAWFWKECLDMECITINWMNKTDLTKFKTINAVEKALKKANQGKRRSANSIWRFVREVHHGHIVVANKGHSRVVGIGVVESEYLPPNDPDNPNQTWEDHRQVHRVKWIVKDAVELSAKQFFVQDTVWPLTLDQCSKIKRAYLREHPHLADTLDQLFPFGCSQAEDIGDINSSTNIGPTTKKLLVDARLGQGEFRKAVLERWGQCCAVTSTAILKAIRASHIKPWRESSNQARLDANNGLPLIAHLDALFDAGLISFEDSGRMLVSPELNVTERKIFGIEEGALSKPPTAKMAEYLAEHRKRHGFG